MNYWSALRAFHEKKFDFYGSGAMTSDGHWIAFENLFDCFHFQFNYFMQGKINKQTLCLEIELRNKSIDIFEPDFILD